MSQASNEIQWVTPKLGALNEKEEIQTYHDITENDLEYLIEASSSSKLSFIRSANQFYFGITDQTTNEITYYIYNEAAATLFAENNTALCLAPPKAKCEKSYPDQIYQSHFNKLINRLHHPHDQFEQKKNLMHAQELLEVNNQIVLNINDKVLQHAHSLHSMHNSDQRDFKQKLEQNLYQFRRKTEDKICEIFSRDHTTQSIVTRNILPTVLIYTIGCALFGLVLIGYLALQIAAVSAPDPFPLDAFSTVAGLTGGVSIFAGIMTGIASGKDNPEKIRKEHEKLTNSTIGFFKQHESVHPSSSAPPISKGIY